MRHKFEGMKLLNNIPAKMLLTDQIYDGQSDAEEEQDPLIVVSEEIPSVSSSSELQY